MKKKTICLIVLSSIIFLTSSVFAQESIKQITLKDGTVLKGSILAVQNDTYVIRTKAFGDIEVADADIASIITTSAAAKIPVSSQQQPNIGLLGDLGGLGGLGNLGGSGQLQQVQNSIMSDPQMMVEIQSLLQDEEVMKIMSDPNLMRDLMSQDPSVLENNPNIKKLMENPAMQTLINQMMSKGIGRQ